MLLDYVVNPVFCVMFGTLALMRSLPALPYPVGGRAVRGRNHLPQPAGHPFDSPGQPGIAGVHVYRIAELCLSCHPKPD